jgi:hypothetical protein
MYPLFDVVVLFVWSNDPESLVGPPITDRSKVKTQRNTLVLQVGDGCKADDLTLYKTILSWNLKEIKPDSLLDKDKESVKINK